MCTIFSEYVIAVSQLSQQGAVSYFVSNTGCISFLIAYSPVCYCSFFRK